MAQPRSYLARHLRMLSLNMMESALDICAEMDPILKPTWLSLISGLATKQRTTVMDAARDMQVSHVHAQNLLKAMKAKGVVAASPDPDDARRTFYALTAKGSGLVPKVERIRSAIAAAVAEVEAETGVDLMAAVTSFQQALDSSDWKTRVKENLQ